MSRPPRGGGVGGGGGGGGGPVPPLPSALAQGPFPEGEAYDYLLVRLPNGLEALLVSTHREDLARRASWYSLGTDLDQGGGGVAAAAAAGGAVAPPAAEEKKQIEAIASRVARFDSHPAQQNDGGGGEHVPIHRNMAGSSARRRSTMLISSLVINSAGELSNSSQGQGQGQSTQVRTHYSTHHFDGGGDNPDFPLPPANTSGRHLAPGSGNNSGRHMVGSTGGDSGRHLPLGMLGPGGSGRRQSFYSNPSDSTKRGFSYLAAAALCVGVGNFSDPEHVQGLAHVVEHMVFMGSEAYPLENDWDQFMAMAGGESNASTESERTTFHFSLPRESFEEGLDRFTHFFVDPLLHKESMDRELAAINSEFHDSAAEPAFLLAEVMSATAKRGPFQQFACGNAHSLESVDNLHDYVTSFFNKHYVAQNMTAVLYSSDTIEALTAYAYHTLGRIPSSRPQPIITSLPPMFDAKLLGPSPMPFLTPAECAKTAAMITPPGVDGYTAGCVFLVDPPAGHPHVLQITWQLPSQRGSWRTKSLDYIGNAIGHETNGSVLKECKARGWATALMSTGDAAPEGSGLENNSAATLFQVYIVLTELGVLEWVKVVQLVYEYIGMLHKDGIQKWLYEELRKCALAGYLFRDVPNPALYVEALAQRMCANSHLPRERVVNGSELFFEFDEAGIRNLLDQLTPENAKVELITRLVRLAPPALWESSTSGGSGSMLNGSTSSHPPPLNGGAAAAAGNHGGGGGGGSSDGGGLLDLGGGNHMSATLDLAVDKFLAKKLKRHVFGPLAQACRYQSYRERWYGTTYAACLAPSSALDLWQQGLRRGRAGASRFAKLPPRNVYICEDFYVKAVPRPTLSTGLVGFTFDLTKSGKRVSVVDYDENEALVQDMVDHVRYWVPYDAHADPPTINHEPFHRVDGIDIQITRASDAPALVRTTPFFSLWHLQGGQFSSSRCELHVALEFPRALVGGQPIESAMADLLLMLFEDATVTETYPAFLSGTYLESEFVDGNKFVFVYSGFPSSVQLLMERTLPVFLGCAKQGIGEIAHRNQKVLLSAQMEALMAIYTNYEVPFSSTLDSVLRLDSVDPMAKRQALAQSVSRGKLHKFAFRTVSECRATALYYGNCDRHDCASLASTVEGLMRKHLPAKVTSNGSGAPPRRPRENVRPVFRIPGVAPRTRAEREALGGTRLAGLFSLYTASGPSSSVLVYLQVDAPSATHRQSPVDVKTRLLCELVVQLMKEPLFNSLRTQKKMAYHVTCSLHDLTPPGVLGVFFEIQSHHIPTLKLVDAVDEFLVEFEQELNRLTPLEFERHVRALCLRKMERDPGPSDEARRHFGSILNAQVKHGQYLWNRSKEDSKVLLSGTITKQDAVDFFNSYLHPDSAPARRRLNLLVMGAFEVDGGGYEHVVEELRGIDNAHILGPSDGFLIMQSIEKSPGMEESASKLNSSTLRVAALSPGGLAEFVPAIEEDGAQLPARPARTCWFWWG